MEKETSRTFRNILEKFFTFKLKLIVKFKRIN